MKDEISNKLNGYFEVDETYENENWIRTKIRTFAFGKNRNGSDIINSSLSQFSRARKSIGAIPIVAKYNTDKDDLEGHNVILRKNKDDEYEIYHDTNALGFTSPASTFYMEEVNEGTESSPEYKTYIVIEDVYLWKRFDATKKILEWKSQGIPAKVSMEIDSVEGQFDNDGYFSISDFIFTAIAALGSDVEPCFPKAEIQLYTVNDFKADLKQLMYELTAQTEVEAKGGNKEMEDVTQVQEETVETELGVTEENTEETLTVEDVTEEFNQTDAEVVVDDTVTVDENTGTTEEEITEETFTKEFVSELNGQIQALTTELEALKTYKRNREEQDLATKFTNKLTEEEIKAVFESSKDSSLEVVEEKLMAKFGQKNFSLTESNSSTNIIALNINKETKPDSPYGDFFK